MRKFLKLLFEITFITYDTMINGTKPGSKYENGYYIHGNIKPD